MTGAFCVGTRPTGGEGTREAAACDGAPVGILVAFPQYVGAATHRCARGGGAGREGRAPPSRRRRRDGDVHNTRAHLPRALIWRHGAARARRRERARARLAHSRASATLVRGVGSGAWKKGPREADFSPGPRDDCRQPPLTDNINYDIIAHAFVSRYNYVRYNNSSTRFQLFTRAGLFFKL